MAVTKGRAPVCLDLTRLYSRVGKGALTGIDRVEDAYREHFIRPTLNSWVCVRLWKRWLFLKPEDAVKFSRHLANALAPGRLSKLHTQIAKANLARLAFSKASIRIAVGNSLTPEIHLLSGIVYLNVGHSNIDSRLFAALHATQALIVTMIHDTIPLDFPETQRPGTVENFSTKLDTAGTHSDLIIAVSEFSKSRIHEHLKKVGSDAEIVAVLPGISVPAGRKRKPRHTPTFVVLGTIEPRKNIGFLLDIWKRLATGGHRIELHIVGRRGWNNEAVFRRLDNRPANVFEHNDLDDDQVIDLLSTATALVHPSIAEGFGMPVAEAAGLGITVLCNDLPVFHEFMGDYPVYLTEGDLNAWEATVKDLAEKGPRDTGAGVPPANWRPPSWESHFNIVSKLIQDKYEAHGEVKGRESH